MPELDYKILLGIITIILGIYGGYDYIIDTLRKKQLHIFLRGLFF